MPTFVRCPRCGQMLKRYHVLHADAKTPEHTSNGFRCGGSGLRCMEAHIMKLKELAAKQERAAYARECKS